MSYIKQSFKALIAISVILLSSYATAGRYDGLADVFNKAAKQADNTTAYTHKYDHPGMGGSSVGAEARSSSSIPYNGQWNVKPLTPPPAYDGSAVSKTFNYHAK